MITDWKTREIERRELRPAVWIAGGRCVKMIYPKGDLRLEPMEGLLDTRGTWYWKEGQRWRGDWALSGWGTAKEHETRIREREAFKEAEREAGEAREAEEREAYAREARESPQVAGR